MCIKEAREHLGRFLKRFVLKYKSTIAINESSLSQSEDGKIYFYYGVFPVIMIAVGLVTIFDIYFYWKYHYTSSYSDKKFLYLFPIPCVAPSFFVVNFVMSEATATRLFYQDIKTCNMLPVYDTRLEQDTPERQREKAMEYKNRAKQCCERVLTILTLISLFGIVYLFYHGFWITIALLIYPGRILFGSMFIFPLILAIIPTWITAIKVAENFFDAYNESSSKRFCKGCAWLALLVYELAFWGLFVVMLFYASRFLLGSIDSKNETVKLVLSYLIISVTSLILVWFNTDFVIYSKDKKEIPGGQQEKSQEIPGGQQQNNQGTPSGQ